MKITFQGNFSFTIEGEKHKILINPESESQVDNKVAVSLFSHIKDDNKFGDKPAIAWPGEFEYGGIAVKSINTRGERIAQYFEVDGIRIAFLGDLKKLVSQEKIEKLVNADILFLPKSTDGMNNKDLKKFAEEIDPRILIMAGDETLFEELLKELGAENTEKGDVFEIEQSKLPQEHTQYVQIKKS